jgi:hypothetical protein
MGVATRLAAGHLREAGIVAFLANQRFRLNLAAQI